MYKKDTAVYQKQMSNQQNDIYKESAKEKFDELVAAGDWQGVNELGIRLEADGMKDLEVELHGTLTPEDIAEYKKWDELTNGSTETQMDDNSGQDDRGGDFIDLS